MRDFNLGGTQAQRRFWILIFILCILVFSAWPITVPEPNSTQVLLSPSMLHWFGTDSLGRDFFERSLLGLQMSLIIGLFATGAAMFIGILVGSLWALGSKVGKNAFEIFVDTYQSLPNYILYTIFSLAFGGLLTFSSLSWRGPIVVILSLSATQWINVARLTKALVHELRESDFVKFSVAAGATETQIWKAHVFKHLRDHSLLWFGLQLPSAILGESFLSFMGLGIEPPQTSVGILIGESWRSLGNFPHLSLIPGLLLLFLVYSCSVLFGQILATRLPKD